MALTSLSHFFGGAIIVNQKELDRFSPVSSAASKRETEAGFGSRLFLALPTFRSSRCHISSKDAQAVEVAAEVQSFIPFHLAIPVHDISAAREFYGGILGLPEGRSAKTWVDFNLYGHQLVCHQVVNYNAESSANAVDGDPVPVPHFGLAMSVSNFLDLAQRVETKAIKFVIKPHVRFRGQPGEQWTMFFKDKSGNSLEFKAMTNPNNLFAKYVVE